MRNRRGPIIYWTSTYFYVCEKCKEKLTIHDMVEFHSYVMEGHVECPYCETQTFGQHDGREILWVGFTFWSKPVTHKRIPWPGPKEPADEH